ncbi:MAG TPA: hypothetical protein ENJ64_04325 [Thiotrichales bacterium]|nr:hypothetical protein [Thiotrichales bacterium]
MQNTKRQLARLARWCSLGCAVTIATPALAATDSGKNHTEQKNSETAYVDSVYDWGAWELDIEPAAGGVQADTSQPLNPRQALVTLRTNSTAALAPKAPPQPGRPALPVIPTPPVAPPAPTPSIPTITVISPSVPPPVGGPNDGF